MIESLYIAETGMSSQQKLIEVISNNIANSSTTAYKKTQLNFVDLVYQQDVIADSNDGTINQANSHGVGVKVSTDTKDFSVGELKQTGNPFDVAIQGSGFIEVQMENGDTAYTRAGRLRLNSDGYLVSSHGYVLSASIQLPPDASDMAISNRGVVTALIGSTGERIELGQIELTNFTNPEGLKVLGSNLYSGSEKSGNVLYGLPGEMGLGELLQGMTEVSNVSMTEEMVNLMLAQRGYQLNARIIQVSDQLLDTINNLRR
ncbi:flagellar basal-body rod protein FlgG [Flocculibacter collagenilyticus]|uniref:flagellar basal-body rod protein FlgG n=1 Tax=Flocculibacter collagenilyticus TaxID=2744479 RepID=UPI0018F5BF77|nr:flagellar basal-body rod protein FlgG [Flocculibacter collagenilyticus]